MWLKSAIPGRSTYLTLSSWPILAGNRWPRTLLSHLPTCPVLQQFKPLRKTRPWLLLVPPCNFFQVRPFNYILKLPLKSQTPQHLTQLRLIHRNLCLYIKAFTVFAIIYKTTGTAPKSTGNVFSGEKLSCVQK